MVVMTRIHQNSVMKRYPRMKKRKKRKKKKKKGLMIEVSLKAQFLTLTNLFERKLK
jgi:hypothetical protein